MNLTSTRDRLGNWATWSRGGVGSSTRSMTGVVCDRMRGAVLGEVWSGSSGPGVVENGDAELVERAWKTLAPKHRELLRWHYIRNANPGFICRRLGIAARPTSVFDIELVRAEEAIGRVLSAVGAAPFHRAPGCAPKS